MQAQSTRIDTQAITSSQSLTAVQTLLLAGLGCITFLRNLLPDENFTESYFTAANDTDVSPDTSLSSIDHGQKRNISGFKIMTMKRGYTEEADRVLNYLEHGIFDALQKQYLRSFIFAIYLNNKDPNNIVEAYTFNFHYHAVPGTDAVVPILTLGGDLQKMSLNQHKDPVAEATLKGRTPTLKEVKKSVKSLLKTLIHAMTQMDVLPKRRFATFKLFYTEKAPPDYEPPYFQAGDAEKDRWYLMTHDLEEVPDRWSVGRVNTGHHSVSLSVTSIATYLPSSTKFDNAIFGGTTSQSVSTVPLTPGQEALTRARQAEEQLHDANDRNVVWAAEGDVEPDVDAEGEDDPDYVMLPDGTYERKPDAADSKNMVPLGLKDKDGTLAPLPMEVDSPEAQYDGILEVVPTKLAELVIVTNQSITSEVDQTQSVDTSVQIDPVTSATEEQINGTIAADHARSNLHQETERDPNPAAVECTTSPSDGINSYHGAHISPTVANNLIDKGLDCECGVSIEEDLCFCEGGCARWYHLWCMGYHSLKDVRIPSDFICFDCRLRADLSWELVKIELYPKLISRFRELALFRRAIKVAELKKPTNAAGFSKFFDSDHRLARQLVKRLEAEGFIFDQTTVVDDSGLTGTHARNTRGKGKKKDKLTKKKAAIKPVFVFNHAAKTSKAYTDYFDPDPGVQSRLLGLSELTSSAVHPAASTINHARDESQTQEETQLAALASLTLNQARDDCGRPRKKIKISVATGVDLAE